MRTIALVALSATLLPGIAWAQDGAERRVLRGWAEEQFLRVGKSCFNKFKAKRGKTVIPADVRDWSALADKLDTAVDIYPTSSLNRLFTTVWRKQDTAWVAQPVPFATTWPSTVPPLLYKQASNARKEHNCTTLLAASAETKLDIGFADLRAALKASTSDSQSLTAFVYAGTIISPVSSALGKNTTEAYTRPIAPFAVIMSLWNWYKNNPALIAAGVNGELRILNQAEGIAFYQMRGITQKTMLSGDAGFSLALPIFSASGSGRASSDARAQSEVEDLAIAVWNQVPLALPTPLDLVASARNRAQFVPVEGNPTLSNGTPFSYSLDLINIPDQYCEDFWTLAPGSSDTNGAQTTNLNVSRVVGDPNRCRFTFQVRPPASAPGGQIEIPLTVKSTIGGAGSSAVEMVLNQRFTISDGRADFNLYAPPAARVALPASATAGPTQKITIAYSIVERLTTRRINGVTTSVVPIDLTCDGIATSQQNAVVTFNRSNNDVKVQLESLVPAALFRDIASGAAPVRCAIGGRIGMSASDGTILGDVPLPSATIELVRDLPEQAPRS